MTDINNNQPDKVPYLPTEQTFAALYPQPEKSVPTSTVYIPRKRTIRQTKRKKTTSVKKRKRKRRKRTAKAKKKPKRRRRKKGKKNKPQTRRRKKRKTANSGGNRNLFNI